jgi:hypothetical protein
MKENEHQPFKTQTLMHKISHYYIPHFTGLFLDIKLCENIHANMYPDTPLYRSKKMELERCKVKIVSWELKNFKFNF